MSSETVRLFGGVEILGPAGSTSLSGAKQRAVAARLALDAGRTVSLEQLIDSIWGEEMPSSVRASLQVHISQIRKSLTSIGLSDTLVTRSGGYAFDVDPRVVDLLLFEHRAADATAAAQAGDRMRAVDLALETLELWRGSPLAGVGDLPFVLNVATRLSGIRLDVATLAADNSIDVDRVADVLATVESLVVEHPYAERVWSSLARMLYAQGRQADALDRLATVRRALRDDLGLDPSPELAALERQILVHDASLAPEPRAHRPARGGAVGSNLPLLRSLVGRDELIAEVTRRLADARLVTLTGPGGVGKTSVAAHAAGSAGSSRRDGACFVDLTDVPADQDPLPSLTSAIGMVAQQAPTLDDVVDALSERDQLLVLDNCEHVLDGSADLADALLTRTRLTVLTTSREPLGLPDEVVIEVPPLSAADGIELFARRARASVNGFLPSGDDVAAVERIVALVDGIPLALELASPLLRVLSPREIADELSHDRTLAAPTRRAARPRHSSMDNAVAWSYDLLGSSARALFERFAVFEGGTDLSGVIEVCGDADDVGRLPRAAVGEALQSLVTRSLLAVERTSSGTRYRMLVPVHSFAKRLLERSGEAGQLRRRHADHVIGWLGANARVVESDDPSPGLDAFGRATANIRAAHDWCIEIGDKLLAAEVLAAMSTLVFREVTTIPELPLWIAAALECPDLPPATRMRVQLAAALFLDESQGQLIERSRDALQLARALGDRQSEVLAATALAHAVAESDGPTAISMMLDVLPPPLSSDSAISAVVEGFAFSYLCNYLLRARRHTDVQQQLRDRLAFGSRRFGLYEAEILYQSARLSGQIGDLAAAERTLQAAEEAALRTGAVSGRSFAIFGLAHLAYKQDDLERSLQLFQEALQLDLLVDQRETWADRMYIGVIACRLGDADLATAQLSALVGDGRPIVRQARAYVAGCVAAVNDAPDVADRNFRSATALAASMGSNDHLAEICTEWARHTRERSLAESLHALSVQLRSGELSAADAQAMLEAD